MAKWGTPPSDRLSGIQEKVGARLSPAAKPFRRNFQKYRFPKKKIIFKISYIKT
jgi:hypothetical protein